jgi:hypothetical protein
MHSELVPKLDAASGRVKHNESSQPHFRSQDAPPGGVCVLDVCQVLVVVAHKQGARVEGMRLKPKGGLATLVPEKETALRACTASNRLRHGFGKLGAAHAAIAYALCLWNHYVWLRRMGRHGY